MRRIKIRTGAFNKCSEILPTYDVIGFYEKAAPVYILTLRCEITSVDRLPIIHDTLLRLFKQKMGVETIPEFLGLSDTPEILETARIDLASEDMIDHRTNKLSERGRNYLLENGLDQNKQVYFTVEIDGITGKYTRKSKLVGSKNLANQNITELFMRISQPNIQSLDKEKVRTLFFESRDEDMVMKKQKIADVLSIQNIRIDYRRLYCIILRKGETDFKVLTFDRNIHTQEYDSFLEEELSGNNTLATVCIDTYLADSTLKCLSGTTLTLEQTIEEEYIRDFYDNLIFEAKRSIEIVLPTISYMMIKDEIIDYLENRAKLGVKVTIYLTGSLQGGDAFQRKQISKIASIKNENFSVQHIPNFMENIVFIDDYTGIIIDYVKIPVSVDQQRNIISESGAIINFDFFNKVKKKIIKLISNLDDNIFVYEDRNQLVNDMTEIMDSFYDLESHIRKRYGYFIRTMDSEEFTEIENVKKPKISNTESSFKNFTSNLNKLFYEPIPNKNKFFFGKLQNDFPDLFVAIDRIRVYRNSIEHRELDPRQKMLYEQYLKEDLNGRSPLLVKDGYAILQGKIMQKLHESICKQ